MHTISNQRTQQTKRPCLLFQKGRILGTELCPDSQTAGAAVEDRQKSITLLPLLLEAQAGLLVREWRQHLSSYISASSLTHGGVIDQTQAQAGGLRTEPTSQPATFSLSLKIFPAQGRAQPNTCPSQAETRCHQQHSESCWG